MSTETTPYQDSPFSDESKSQILDDWELLEFLLKSPYVLNQVQTSKRHISAEVKGTWLKKDFFAEMKKPGRPFSVASNHVWFPRKELKY